MTGARFVPVSAYKGITVPRDTEIGSVEGFGGHIQFDDDGNTLKADRCSLCRRCWVYDRMKDHRRNSMLGRCIYGGPFSGFVEGYRPGEVEAARSGAYEEERR